MGVSDDEFGVSEVLIGIHVLGYATRTVFFGPEPVVIIELAELNARGLVLASVTTGACTIGLVIGLPVFFRPSFALRDSILCPTVPDMALRLPDGTGACAFIVASSELWTYTLPA